MLSNEAHLSELTGTTFSAWYGTSILQPDTLTLSSLLCLHFASDIADTKSNTALLPTGVRFSQTVPDTDVPSMLLPTLQAASGKCTASQSFPYRYPPQ
jgi:hypothetical protein